MAIDEVQIQHESPPPEQSHTGLFVAIFVILAALVVGEIYTLSQISSMRGSLDNQQTRLQKDQQEVSNKVSNIERSEAEQLEALKTQLQAGAKRNTLAGGELRRARAMVAKLEKEQQQENEALKQEIAHKADQQQLSALNNDVSSTKTELDGTKKSVDSLRSDLGMAKSELGTLIARNHDDIETLRKLGDRDYFEFTLDRKHPQHVAGIGLVLKKANPKAHKFNVVLQADDMSIEKKDRTANEPIFFFVGGEKKPYELVINKVQSASVKGYLSAPKGAVEAASTARSGGSQ
jgi:hypothetical protein